MEESDSHNGNRGSDDVPENGLGGGDIRDRISVMFGGKRDQCNISEDVNRNRSD
jgi:hypothetical protein